MALSSPDHGVTDGMISVYSPIQIASQPERTTDELHVDSKGFLLPPTSAGASVFGSGAKHRIQFDFAAGALQDSQDFAIGNHVIALIIHLVDGHAIDQPKSSRFRLECGFQHIGTRKVSAGSAVFAGGGDSPKAASLDVENGAEKGRTVKPGPAKPV